MHQRPNPTGAGHFKDKGQTNNGGNTTGGTEGGIVPVLDGKIGVIHKDYVLDYTSALKDVIMETESGVGGLTYRYTYGLEKVNVVINGVPNGAGSVMQYVYNQLEDGTGEWVLESEAPAGNVQSSSIVKLWYHEDRLGSTSFLTDNVQGKVTSFVSYDDWGSPTMKAILRMGVRELDLVTEYTGHPYDAVLSMYFAEARMYDASDRRFVAMDALGGSIVALQMLNRYTYVHNNPLRFTDPSGLAAVTLNTDEGEKEIRSKIENGKLYVNIYDALKVLGFTDITELNAVDHMAEHFMGTFSRKVGGMDLTYLVNVSLHRNGKMNARGVMKASGAENLIDPEANGSYLLSSFSQNLVNGYWLDAEYFEKFICSFTGEKNNLKIDAIFGDIEMRLSPEGIAWLADVEGHNKVLKNGNYAVEATSDRRLTTYLGVVIGTWSGNKSTFKGMYYKSGLEVTDANAKYYFSNGIPPTIWRPIFDYLQTSTFSNINQFMADNGITLSQNQFDALVSFGWVAGAGEINQREGDGSYKFDLFDVLLEPGFLSNPTADQLFRFEGHWGNQIRMDGKRIAGMWVRRMGEVDTFLGNEHQYSTYWRDSAFKSDVEKKNAANTWLKTHGKPLLD